MLQQIIDLIRETISYLIRGWGFDEIEGQLGITHINTPMADIRSAVDYAKRSYGFGQDAEVGDFTTFQEIPGVSSLGDMIRVRLTIRPTGTGAAGAVTMDVLTLPSAGIGAVKSYGYEYAADIAAGHYTLQARQGSAAGFESPEISVQAIFPGADTELAAKKTERLVF